MKNSKASVSLNDLMFVDFSDPELRRELIETGFWVGPKHGPESVDQKQKRMLDDNLKSVFA